MKLRLPLSLARPLTFAAVTTRLLMGIFLDLPWLYNAGWIAALGAILLCVPLGLLADRAARACRGGGIAEALEKRGGRAVARPVFALLSLVCIYETAVTSRVLSNTVRHVALAEASAISLLLPLLLAAMLCACLGGQAIGGGGAHLGARDARADAHRAAPAISQLSSRVVDASARSGRERARLRDGERLRLAVDGGASLAVCGS